MASTRDTLLAEGMRLFGEQGYAATSVAQIEAAAGLAPGSGSLYKHFRSKDALLAAGLDRLLASGGALAADRGGAGDPAGLIERLTVVARAGLGRLEEDRDLNRLLFRGLHSFPELLQRFGDEEIRRIHQDTTALLAELGGDRVGAVDWAAIAVVLQGATAHYWLLADLFGQHPTGVDQDRFVAGLVTLAAAVLTSTSPTGQDPVGTVVTTAAAGDRPETSRETQ